jgi:hypothetical protein
MGAFIERGVDLADGRVVDPAGAAEVADGLHPVPMSACPSSNSPLNTVAVDRVEKADPFDDFGNRFPGARGVAVRAGKFDGARLDRADEIRPVLRRLVDQMHAVDGFHMREHFVDIGDAEANVPRPADVVRLVKQIGLRRSRQLPRLTSGGRRAVVVFSLLVASTTMVTPVEQIVAEGAAVAIDVGVCTLQPFGTTNP